jgi:hypothetical protein
MAGGYNLMSAPQRLEHFRDPSAEYSYASHAQRPCNVHRTAVVANEQIASLQQGDHPR